MSTPADPSILQRIVALVLACLISIAAMFSLVAITEGSVIGFRSEESALGLTGAALTKVATDMGCDAHGLSITIDHKELSISARDVFGPMDHLLLLAAIVIAATIAACRTWGFGRLRSAILILLSTLLSLPLILILPGALAGVALGSSSSISTAAAAVWIARDAGLLLACAIIALLWWLAAWLGDEDKSPPASPPAQGIAFTTSMMVAITTGFLLATLRLLMAVGATIAISAHASEPGTDPSLAMRLAIGGILLAASATMILVSIFRTSLVRWAWLPALAVIPLGDITAAVPLLAAIIAARDQRFRLLRGLPLGPLAPAKVAARAQQPLTPWIWALAAPLACGAWLRFTHVQLNFDYGLQRLAHPALFFPLLIATAILGFWQWKNARRHTGRRLIAPALAALVAAACVTMYGIGYRREVSFNRELAASEPYFNHVEAAFSQIPTTIGPWLGHDQDMVRSAMQLHDPNAILSRSYRNPSLPFQTDLLMLQWRDVRDLMVFHPPFYFPGRGFTMAASDDVEWTVGTRHILGTHYTFQGFPPFPEPPIHVLYFIISPTGQFMRDFSLITPEMRIKGAAQFQLVITGDCPPETIRQITTDFITAALPAIDAVTEH